MIQRLLTRLPAQTWHLAYLLAVSAAAVLAFFLPAGATPAQSGVRMLHRAVKAAPRLQLKARGGEFWHTDRNRILDEHNREVRIAGVNWSGFETRRGVPGGLTLQDYHTILSSIRAEGYNTIRIPLSNEMVETPAVPSEIAFTANGQTINADLDGLNSMQILDKIVSAAGSMGLKIILDNHRSEAGDSAEASGLWFTPEYSEDAWIADWVTLAKHFRNNPTVIGMDLRNEPHNAATNGACWDCGGARDWHLAATRAGNAVLRVHPRALIFVEGVDTYAGESYWWGGNLMGVRHSPVHLAIPNRLVYSAHVYGPAEYSQPWFNENTTSVTLRTLWRRRWAYISEGGYAPVWIGEFGTPKTDDDVRSTVPGSEGQWFSELVRFLHEEPSLQWTYWGINGEDRYGLFDSSYSAQPASTLKSQLLATILPSHLDLQKHPPFSTAAPVETPASPAPSAASVQPASVAPHAPAGDPFAEAARQEVEQSLSTFVVPEQGRSAPAVDRPAHHESTPSSPANGRKQVNSAEASDVQRAIAAAMRSTSTSSQPAQH